MAELHRTLDAPRFRPVSRLEWHTFIYAELRLVSGRSRFQAAYDCVDAVMGNRHVRLYWARESDFEQEFQVAAAFKTYPDCLVCDLEVAQIEITASCVSPSDGKFAMSFVTS
jgi:hypothetical protein